MVHRGDLHGVLLKACQAHPLIELRVSSEVTGYDQDGTTVSARLGNDERVDVGSLRLSTRSAGTSSAERQGVLTPQGIKGIRIARGPGRPGRPLRDLSTDRIETGDESAGRDCPHVGDVHPCNPVPAGRYARVLYARVRRRERAGRQPH